MPITQSARELASYPSPPVPTVYQSGALRARPMEYRAGFLDAIGAYLLLALEGCQLNPDTWDVLADIERR